MKIPTPNETRERLRTQGHELLNRCADAIHRTRTLSRPVTVTTKGTTSEQVNFAVDTLRSRGWNVRHVHDSRDGNYLEISP